MRVWVCMTLGMYHLYACARVNNLCLDQTRSSRTSALVKVVGKFLKEVADIAVQVNDSLFLVNPHQVPNVCGLI